ncbi:winged helix-turn-helix domain-containing protein [Nonomuraea sp. NPDC050310]|uniref:ArsR/SmtB family transcription factor n=1 Tax=Nonomuraea sp. NPDC050310 TaxID=3154935 RepID=UPI0033D31161
MHGYSQLHTGALDDVNVTVSLHAGATLLSLIAGTLGGRPHGVPRHWQRAVAAVIGDDAVILRPLFDPHYSVIPDCLTATSTMAEADMRAYLSALAELDDFILLRELEAEFGPVLPRHWHPVADCPGTWIRAYAGVMNRLWEEFRTVWKSADTLLRKEQERIGLAAVTRSLPALLPGLSERLISDGASIRLPDQQGRSFDLSGRRLTFVPVISGQGACLFSFDQPGPAWIGYPLPAVGLLWGGPTGRAARDDTDKLALALGHTRAAILRLAGTPIPIGRLAALLNCSPSTASYHCDQLQAADLLSRHRHGRHVHVKITERGDELLAILA